jgi:hypothetical protein
MDIIKEARIYLNRTSSSRYAIAIMLELFRGICRE